MVSVNPHAFRIAHNAFERHMEAHSEGEPFVGFHHSFLLSDEIRYKIETAGQANKALQLDQWYKWRGQPKRIINAVRQACAPGVSRNLLEHRWGSPLSDVPSAVEPELARRLFEFFLGGTLHRETLGPRFDELAGFLRRERLGCQWILLAYFTFIANPMTFFPIRPIRFQRLARYYGIDLELVGKVEWARYETLLDMAEVLSQLLSRFRPQGAIDLQSYMWVVAYLVAQGLNEVQLTEVDWATELARRQSASNERERLGLLGEQLVMDREQRLLQEAGLSDLAERVELVSAMNLSLGFDVRSFSPSGSDRHIEVKSTQRSPDRDRGFWLTQNERRVAEEDAAWIVVRVCQVDFNPQFLELGNIVRDSRENWILEPDTWFVRHRSG